jgi:Leucine-rich repeat (LRR) protein
MNIEGENPATSNPSEPTPTKRRWRGLSLRASMLLVLVISGALGWWLHKARVQREAVAAIQRRGSVTYDWQWRDNKPVTFESATPWPNWLLKAVGPEFLGNVTCVNLGRNDPSNDDALMAHVGRLGQLEQLQVVGLSVSDEGIFHLRNLTHLRMLRLEGTRVQGPGLVHLKRLTRLEDLRLPSFPFTDDDLSHLAGLTRLTNIAITGDRVTNAGLAHFRAMGDLQFLNVTHTKITSLEAIRNLTKIRFLDLTDTPIDDKGLEAVANFRELEYLNLSDTGITDAGLDYLCSLPRLTWLDLSRTAVTDAGLTRFADRGGLASFIQQVPGWKRLSLYKTQTTLAGAHALKARFPALDVMAVDGSRPDLPINPVK